MPPGPVNAPPVSSSYPPQYPPTKAPPYPESAITDTLPITATTTITPTTSP
jgi:hypothetical protein